MIVCFCHLLTDAELAEFRARGVRDWKSLARLTKAGSRCRPCRQEIARMLKSDCAPATCARNLDCCSSGLQSDECKEGRA
jgi:bacterioferritin-associated ferredoxin